MDDEGHDSQEDEEDEGGQEALEQVGHQRQRQQLRKHRDLRGSVNVCWCVAT
jgi:hypothetical protein